MSDHAHKAELFEQIARVGKALASGKRLELLDLLAQGERTVDELARAAGLGLTTASSHLQTLKQAHLVATRRAGTRIFYALAGDDVAALFAQCREVARAHIGDVERARILYLGTEREPDAANEVASEELRARQRTGPLTVLDVRPAVEFAAGHIPGALSIPLEELGERLAELPEDTEVIVYCRGAYCRFAYDAVHLLHADGRRARRLTEGMLEWRLKGLTVEAAP